jgi:hypothetical protein
MGPGASLTILACDDHFALALWRNVFIVLWRRQPDAARTETMHDVFNKVAAQTPGGVAVTVVIEAGVPPPDPTTRARITEVMRANAAANRGIAYIIEETGFVAAAMRSVVTGTLLIVRPPYPARVFATVKKAAPWLLAQAGAGEADIPALTTALESLRRQLHMAG